MSLTVSMTWSIIVAMDKALYQGPRSRSVVKSAKRPLALKPRADYSFRAAPGTMQRFSGSPAVSVANDFQGDT